MAEIRRRPAVLLAEGTVRRLPVGDCAVKVLFVPIGVGPMEPQAGGVHGFGVCSGHNRRWHTVALPRRRAVGGYISNRGGKRRG